jgi:uncharacterized membrane protein
VQVQLQL